MNKTYDGIKHVSNYVNEYSDKNVCIIFSWKCFTDAEQRLKLKTGKKSFASKYAFSNFRKARLLDSFSMSVTIPT